VSRGDLPDRDYRALARFRRALRLFLRFSEEAAREAGVTPAQHQLLLAVRGHPGTVPPSTSELADALQLKVHSVVELVDRAQRAGLVARSQDPADARRQLVTVTPAGLDVLRGLAASHRDELRRFRREMVDVLRELDGDQP
jgi:DNA-binding MarR family transcriptional regulator